MTFVKLLIFVIFYYLINNLRAIKSPQKDFFVLNYSLLPILTNLLNLINYEKTINYGGATSVEKKG